MIIVKCITYHFRNFSNLKQILFFKFSFENWKSYRGIIKINISCILSILLFFRFLKLGFSNKDGSTLLHLAVNENTPVDDFHVK